jgi:CP family cyanate transporter-like MFS transporter
MAQKPLGWDRPEDGKAAAPGSGLFGLSFNEAFRTGAFWLLITGICLAGMPMTGVKVFGPTFWQSFGMAPQASANYAGLLTVFCTVAMMASGFIADKLGLKAYITYIFLAFTAGSVMYLYWPLHQGAAYTSLSLLVISLASPTSAISSTITPEVFGPKDFTSINGKIMGAFYFGVAVVAVLIGALRDITGSFEAVWIFLAAAAIAAMICCLMALRIAPVKKLLNK